MPQNREAVSEPMSQATYEKLKAMLRSAQHMNESQIPQITALRRLLEQHGRDADSRVLNAFVFTLLSNFELVCLMEDMVDHDPTYRGHLYARLVIVNIYETSLKFKSLLAKDFRADLATAGVSSADINELATIHRGFVHLFEECNRLYGDVRRGIGAHKDLSAEKQLALIEKATIHDVADLVTEMMKWTSMLMRIFWVHTVALAASAGIKIELDIGPS
jgi:hypothetical protein